MRGLTGLTLILAGGALAFYGFYPEASERTDSLDRVLAAFRGEATPTAAETADLPLVVVDPQRRAFSPQAPLFQQVPGSGAIAGDAPQLKSGPVPAVAAQAHASDPSAPRASPVTTKVAAAGAVSTTPVATGEAGTRIQTATTEAVAAPAPNVSPASGRAEGDGGKRDLTRALQKELKRVGCYDGDISGTWSTASRRAMKSFTDRVNATLPVDEPDYILLTLVQGHAAEACGANCPGGQVMAKDGTCQPPAIVAKSEKKSSKRLAAKPSVKSAPSGDAMTKSPEVGRAIEMWAKVTPQGTAAASGKLASTDGWKTAVIAAPPTHEPAPVSQSAPVTQSTAAVAPLPGRMAIGGPVGGPVAPRAPPAVTASIAAVEAPLPAASADTVASARRIPRHVVRDEAPRPRRAKSSNRDDYAAPAPKPVRTTSKAARVRAMHYNLFSRPDRTTN